MGAVGIRVGPLAFAARWEETNAPRTCAAFRRLLPYRQRIIQARWLFYPGGISETEILFPYGTARFASVKGPLAGNHFLTIVEGRERLGEVGRLLCWEGAQDISFEA